MVKVNRFGLLHSLFSIINQFSDSDTDYIIAKYLLDNYKTISELNIYQVSEDCFVSRATIRRFCSSIGFDNFKELKNEFSKYDDQSMSYYDHYYKANYLDFLSIELEHMIADMRMKISEMDLEHIVDKIHHSERVVFFTSSSGASSVMHFQHGMLLFNKLIYIISENFEYNQLLFDLNEDDVVFILSGTAGLAKASIPILKKIETEKILFTLSRDLGDLGKYCRVEYVGSIDSPEDGRSVYYTYGFRFLLDTIFAKYLSKYVK